MTEEYVLKDTGKLGILNFKPNYNICFHRGNEKVGVLDFNGPEMTFSGDMDESAKLFLEFIATSFKTRLEQERAVGYREGHMAALAQRTWVGLTDEEERKAFEQWYVCNAFDYERNPIGSRECGLQWSAWKARAAHGIKGEA